MRGGALPVLLWGTGLLVLMVINVIWTADSIQVGMFGFAVGVLYLAVIGLWIADRRALRRGPPELSGDPEAVPSNSLSALALGVATGAMLFGAVFGKFLVFIGGGVWLLAAGRLILEVRAQRRSIAAEIERGQEHRP